MRITPLNIRNEREAQEVITSIGVSPKAKDILSPKSVACAFKIEGVKSWEANIIKQHLLSLGTDSAIQREALLKNIHTDTLIFGSVSQLRKLCEKLKYQPFTLREISQKLSLYLDNLSKDNFIFKARSKTLHIKKPLLCGIVNITPDSFSGDGLMKSGTQVYKKLPLLALKKVEVMVKEGADMVDIGGESTRPFSKPVRVQEEIKRVIPALGAIRREFKRLLISIDTYKSPVARQAADKGVDIINDISALRKSPQMSSVIKKYKLGCILMHMKGSPATMQRAPAYQAVVEEIIDFFTERIAFCIRKGIGHERIMIDPGIGFGKRVQDNLTILNQLYKFKIFGRPLFMGVSRKSFIGNVLGVPVQDRLPGTIAASTVALLKRADVLRVHDIRQTAQAIKIVSGIVNN